MRVTLPLLLLLGLACAAGTEPPPEDEPDAPAAEDPWRGDAPDAPERDRRKNRRPAPAPAPKRERPEKNRRPRPEPAPAPAPAPSPAPAPAPAPVPDSFSCWATGTWRSCEVEGKRDTCEDKEVRAGGPGSSRAEAERNAVEACDAHMATLVSFGNAGKGSAQVLQSCRLESCD